ncbi:hypothetical protein K457DRAFT_125860 [Linnemannia elongata AG-77]|uniref:Uncharacterized protein n=1 Tax=Linnemannia elongata AG-77 TaxID=1314771 RepID=A0A197JVQ5_9FUNG|nr:hypothetical protein K457DRAFT_125860 [Linnemannia elongata AG-77]
MQANAGVQPKDPKPRDCLDCGVACHRDNCCIIVTHRGSWYRPLCKECERMRRASTDVAQRAAGYFTLWWRRRKLIFESRYQAGGLVLTVFLRGVCVGAPHFSGREVAHLRLQAQSSTSIDWYDHVSLSAGNCDPMKQFTTDRITSGSDKKILPYSHHRQCTVAASAWKNEIFMELTLKQRVDYMLYWCDPEKREEGFKKADTILLELFERFDLEDEMKIDFTEHDDHRWRDFCHSKRKKKDRIAWNNNGQYRLGACIYIPQGLNFAKELLEDFKTSKLFQGTDLENCRKGINILRDLMIETAEKMKHRLPKLLEEHAALIADLEDSDNKEVQVLEEAVEDIYDQYETAPEEMALTDCDTQGMIMDRDDTFDGVGNSYEFIYDLSEEMNPREYGEETAASLWKFVFAESDEDDSFSDFDHDQAIPTLAFATVEEADQSDNKLLQRLFDRGEIESRSDTPMSTITLPLHFETESDLIVHPRRPHAGPWREKVESTPKSTWTIPDEDGNSRTFNTALQEPAHKKLKPGLNDTKALQENEAPNLKTTKKLRQTIHTANVVSSSSPSVFSPLRQPLISDSLSKGGKENRPPRLP